MGDLEDLENLTGSKPGDNMKIWNEAQSKERNIN